MSELGKIIWDTSRADEGSISVMGADVIAIAILDSDWLAVLKADVRKAALLEAARIAESGQFYDARGELLSSGEIWYNAARREAAVVIRAAALGDAPTGGK